MIKKKLRKVYLPIFVTYRYYKNFLIQNIFNSPKYLFSSIPDVIQKLKFTGAGKIIIGKNARFGDKLGGFYHSGIIEIQARSKNALITVGNNLNTNNNIFICAYNKIDIGNDVLIGPNVTIMDFEAHGVSSNKRNKLGSIGFILIESNVWIGSNVTILKNSIIGKNSIIAAGSVVSGEFPENVIIGGVPAKIIKKIS